MSLRRRTPGARARPAPARGAALLVAMVLVTVVATLAAGMVWQQWRAVQVEAAERARVQSLWILQGATDWARLILREDARSGKPTALTEPWATPLAEARLSTFLAAGAGPEAAAADDGPDAFLAGAIVDAQARYNLRHLVDGAGQVQPTQLQVLRRICQAAGLPAASAEPMASGLASALGGGGREAPLAPRRLADLAWMGVDEAALRALEPFLIWLPQPTPLNLNTAAAEVLAAVLPQADAGLAGRLVAARRSAAFVDIAAAAQAAGVKPEAWKEVSLGVRSDFFEVEGRLRLGERVVQERSLVMRQGLEVSVLHRERRAATLAGMAAPAPP